SRRRHTRSKRDWSSDVCSSDLLRADMPGADITEDAVRVYAQGDVFPHGIGYVGPIYAEEYEQLKESGYTISDTIGKSGIEKAMRSEERRVGNGTRETRATGRDR